jgi:hypothetical protein
MFALSLVSSIQEAAEEVAKSATPNANPVAGSFLYFVGAMALFIFVCAWLSSSSDKS